MTSKESQSLQDYTSCLLRLETLETSDLLHTIRTMKRGQKAIEAQALKEGRKFSKDEGEQHYSLGSLLEEAALEMETRCDSYTGERDS